MDIEATKPINILSEHHCFGCGQLNQHGLQLSFFANPDGNGVWAPFTPTDAFEGYGGIIHGGIVCTILDEVMAWSLYRERTWAVTGQLNTRFRKPMVVGEPVRATGRIVNDRGRIIEMRADIRRETDNRLIAEGAATFFRVPEAQAAEWNERYLGGVDIATAAKGVES
jgi:acyl-coenzyme A thioesterase PaaI-like protein